MIADEAASLPTTDRDLLHSGYVMDLVREQVDLGEAGVVTREFVDHPGAVAVVVLDDDDRVLLIRQYRHPVRRYLWEVPAGLLDVQGESLLAAAQRELAEEADLVAEQWHTLVDFYTSPGGSNERLRLFLARGLSPVPLADRYQRGEEELNMQTAWVPLAQAVALALGGQIRNPSAVLGILAVQAVAPQWSQLRAGDAPWSQ